MMTRVQDISADLARLRDYIQGYVDKPGNTESWSGLFARAEVSQGTMNKIRKSDFKGSRMVPCSSDVNKHSRVKDKTSKPEARAIRNHRIQSRRGHHHHSLPQILFL